MAQCPQPLSGASIDPAESKLYPFKRGPRHNYSGDQEHDTYAGAMLAHFDFDLDAKAFDAPAAEPKALRVMQGDAGSALSACFTFNFEPYFA